MGPRIRRLLLAPLFVGCLLLLTVSAGAAQTVRTGWWWVVNDGPVPAPAPPYVPEGGLYVATNPLGTEATAALFVPVAEGSTPVQLRLAVSSVRGEGTVGLCPVLSPWEEVAAGPLSEAPIVDCTRTTAVGAIADDGSAVVFDVSGFAVGPSGGLDVAILPGIGDDSDAAAFQLVLDPPDDRSLTTAPGASAPAPTASVDAPTTSIVPEVGSSQPRGFSAPAPAGSFVPAPSPTPTGLGEGVLPDPLANAAPSEQAIRPTPAARPVAPADARRLLGLVGLGVIAGLWWWDVRRTPRTPRLLVELPTLAGSPPVSMVSGDGS